MMNILLINHYAGSNEYGMEYRPYYLGREWVKQGHNVTIVAADYSHLRLKQPQVSHDLQEEIIEGIKYIWIKTPSYEGTVSRILNMMSFICKLNKYAKQLAKKEQPHLVVASSTYTLDNYPAYQIAKLAGAKYTYEVHDIWPLSPMLIGGYSKHHPFIWIMQRGEDYAYKHVDKVISLLWNSEEHMKERGLAGGKFVCIPNGYNPDDWTEEVFSLPLSKIHQEEFDRLDGKLIVGFAGGFAASGSVETLIKAAALVKDKLNIHFVLVGKGPVQETYEQIIKDKNLLNVSILPSVPKSLVPAIIKHFDIVFLGGTHSKLHQYGTSYNKMTDYMLSAKPIIQAVDEPGSIVERNSCGIRIEAENALEVAESILKLSSMTAEERTIMGEKGRQYVMANLPWSKLAEDFVAAFS